MLLNLVQHLDDQETDKLFAFLSKIFKKVMSVHVHQV